MVTLLTQRLPMTVSSSVNTVFRRLLYHVERSKLEEKNSTIVEQVCTQSLISALHYTIRPKALAQSTSEKAKAISVFYTVPTPIIGLFFPVNASSNVP
jgi:hypothetical protein